MIVKEKNRYEPTKSIFAVFGEKEPNATAALAYIIAKFPNVAKQIVHLVVPRISINFEELEVNKERYKKSSGRTDIEIVGDKIHLIFEGKIGSGIPTIEQTTISEAYTREQIRDEFVDKKSGLDILIANPAAFAESHGIKKIGIQIIIVIALCGMGTF